MVFFFWMTRVFGVDFIWAPKPLTDIHGYSVTINTENIPLDLITITQRLINSSFLTARPARPRLSLGGIKLNRTPYIQLSCNSITGVTYVLGQEDRDPETG
jgi:hypothetical protein